ncbi:hypothetical protein [Caballeronia sp. LZ032]|uniref:hypothetical protein n=1 Tax=Caballeronia sp. LZ032 TaxID=3038565 RepID=UPI002865F518|nr:hypothetical protein [Caballeronia sp. LZ032]MDR5882244.1 hypothetical protein [Caballeronia sp. LZ032]
MFQVFSWGKNGKSKAERFQPAPDGTTRALRDRHEGQAGAWMRFKTPPGTAAPDRKRPTVYWVLKSAVFACAAARRRPWQAVSARKGNALEYAVNLGAQTHPQHVFFSGLLFWLLRRLSSVGLNSRHAT